MTQPSVPSRFPWSLARKLLVGVLAFFAFCIWLCVDWPCFSSGLRWGLWLRECPVGKPLPIASVDVWNLRREQPGQVQVRAWAVYSLGGAAEQLQSAIGFPGRIAPRMSLVDASGKATPLQPDRRWKRDGNARVADLTLPAVPDGDYTLRTVVKTSLGDTTVDAPLPLYAPALVHVATDRPLYKAGQTMQFRAVALRMADLVPLESRPGTFLVTSPQGDTLLEEQVASGPWGMAAADFPLAGDADPGTYTVTWRSGAASDSVAVRVEPFTLPRFQVEVKPSEPWYLPGDTPRIQAVARYRSGAPVAQADVEVRVQALPSEENWPPPTDWVRVRTGKTDKEGEYDLSLGEVPPDLRTQASLAVTVSVTDAAGERISGAGVLKLSASPVTAWVETELMDGLVPDFNNRIYVRVTRPDGSPLAGSTVKVTRAWDASDGGREAVADEDAVAALQIDPGKPISVVIPPRPVRTVAVSQQSRVQRVGLEDYLSDGSPSLGEMGVIDGWNKALEPCARHVESGSSNVQVGVVTDRNGVVARVVAGSNPLERCVRKALKGVKAASGEPHFYAASWSFDAWPGAVLEMSTRALPEVPSQIQSDLEASRVWARPCLSTRPAPAQFPHLLRWRVEKGQKKVTVEWLADEDADGAWSTSEITCIKDAFDELDLDYEPSVSFEGVTRLSATADPSAGDRSQSSTVLSAWELGVEVTVAGKSLGATKVVLKPGTIPDLRLRPRDPLLKPGDEISIKVLRGPDFSGYMPEEKTRLALLQGGEKVGEVVLDPKEKVITGVMPTTVPGGQEAAHGLYTVEWNNARAILLVPRTNALAVTVEADQGTYRPGAQARLSVRTRTGSEPTEAAVSLMGVDEALSQLAPLLQPDDWGRVTVRATTSRGAFGLFDARALLTNQIRGTNAVLATVQRITHIPPAPTREEAVGASGQSTADPGVTLVEVFYDVLADARMRVAEWEVQAPAGEVLTARRMVKLWEDTLSDRESRDLPYEDAWGEPLHLDRLPPDLLMLADPRGMVLDAARLPEDVENWQAFVAEEGR